MGVSHVNFDCIEKRLSRLLKVYGNIVGTHYVPFIVLPIVISVGLAFGGLFFVQNTDTEYLFSPDNGPARKHRAQIEEHFSVNFDGDFTVARQTQVGRYARILVSAVDDGNILRENVLNDIVDLDERVKNMIVTKEGDDYKYDDLCGKWRETCSDPNTVLTLLQYNASNVNNLQLSYPVTAVQGMEYFIGGSLGGVEYLNNTDIIKSAKAMSLLYSLRSDELDDVSGKWEDKFVDLALKYESDTIEISFIISKSLDHDYIAIVIEMFPRLVVAFFVLTIFSVCACMMADWVTSKPILGILGVISALLAVVSAFGLLLLCGVPFIHLVIGMPFLTLGVGVDDMFIMIASWRTTSPRLSVAERLGETFSEAALSITITSLTDALAFGIGAISNFPSVRIFCCYCGVAIVFDYLYQITFFGGCMALIGHREKQNRHCVTMKKVVSKSRAPSKAYRLFCAGGFSSNPNDDIDNASEHIVSKFFAKYYGPFITKGWVKFLTLLLYFGYIGLAIWGCFSLSEGIRPRQLALDNSYTVNYYDAEEKYFLDYGPVIQYVITEHQDYSNEAVQAEVNNVIAQAHQSEYFYSENKYTTQCWLLDYLQFLNQTGFTYTDEDSFISILRNNFLSSVYFEHYKLDIAFDSKNMTIESSRFLVTSRSLSAGTVEEKKEFLHKSRNIAAESSLPMIAYNPSFIFDDHFDAILPSMIQNILIAAAGMLLVSLLLIPQPICSLYVTVSIASIVVGVLGYMAFWDVGLDFVSMITIVVCIGFSVDYSAHVAYIFVISQRDSRNERAIDSLRLLGLPILQSVSSTILAIIPIYTGNTYAFRAIFETLFLGISFGGLHGLLFLPTLLSLIGPGKIDTKSKEELLNRPVDLLKTWIKESSQPYWKTRLRQTEYAQNLAFDNSSLDYHVHNVPNGHHMTTSNPIIANGGATRSLLLDVNQNYEARKTRSHNVDPKQTKVPPRRNIPHRTSRRPRELYSVSSNARTQGIGRRQHKHSHTTRMANIAGKYDARLRNSKPRPHTANGAAVQGRMEMIDVDSIHTSISQFYQGNHQRYYLPYNSRSRSNGIPDNDSYDFWNQNIDINLSNSEKYSEFSQRKSQGLF
ncbi:patched domain-containing protein 3-like [Glandiceps talaboti]